MNHVRRIHASVRLAALVAGLGALGWLTHGASIEDEIAFSGGTLRIELEKSRVEVDCAGGVVKVNGQDPTVAPTPCADVQHIDIDAGDNDHGVLVDLESVTLAQFPNLQSVGIVGGDFDDFLVGSQGPNDIDAGDGSDRVLGGDGEDTLSGGRGDDELDGGDGDDVLEGDQGNDRLIGGDGDDRLDGGSGDDVLEGEDGEDQLIGGPGDDRLAGGDGQGELDGGDDQDELYGGDEDDELRGGDGDDQLTGGRGEDRLSGEAGNDTLEGDDDDDVLDAGEGNDRLEGGDGEDVLQGGEGTDTLSGSSGEDLLDGGGGDDTLAGGEDDDRLLGEDGNDVLQGDAGSDALFGDAGDDQLDGGSGDDELDGGEGNDVLEDSFGEDRLDGGDGNDALAAGVDTRALLGGAGDDVLRLDEAALDREELDLDGGSGMDRLIVSFQGALGLLQLDHGSPFIAFSPSGVDLDDEDFDPDSLEGVRPQGIEHLTLQGTGRQDVVEAFGDRGSDRFELAVAGAQLELMAFADLTVQEPSTMVSLIEVESLRLDGGEGDDVFRVSTPSPGAEQVAGDIVLDGGEDEDLFELIAPSSARISVRGGDGADIVRLDAQGLPVLQEPRALLVEGRQPITYSDIELVDIVDEGPMPPPPPLSLEAALDTDSDGLLNDREITLAVQLWISGTLVPGAQQPIGDAEILQLVQRWITQTPLY